LPQSSDMSRGLSPTRLIARFAVRIKLDDGDDLRLPAGTQGSAAVFSGRVQIAGVIRMAVMRANSWLNYLFFTS